MSRSLNKIQLIGNITRDPELRYTENGTPLTTFTIATNNSWTTSQGEKKEETEFIRIVAWQKLAELCSELLYKGALVYVSGQLRTRKYDKDGQETTVTEVICSDMILLSQPKGGEK